MVNFIAGMITMGYLIAGLFFAKFWTRGRDLLFASFAAAFWLLAIDQALVVVTAVPREEKGWTYLLRIAAFSLIALAILLKNIARDSDSD